MINFDLNKFSDNIAILYSGGVESSLLYYLSKRSIMEKYHDKQIKLFITDRHNRPIEKAIKLLDLMKKSLSDDTTELEVINFDEALPNYLKMVYLIKELETKYDVILWGPNKYPDDNTIRPRPDHTVDFDRYNDQNKLKLPFANYTKDQVIATYYELGIESFLPYTRSCGSDQNEPCKICFNCRERAWAYEKLNMTPEYGL